MKVEASMNGTTALIKETAENSLLLLCEDTASRWPSMSQNAGPHH